MCIARAEVAPLRDTSKVTSAAMLDELLQITVNRRAVALAGVLIEAIEARKGTTCEANSTWGSTYDAEVSDLADDL